MRELFAAITETEYEELKSAISWITILIAGADGNIDTQETEWAEKLTSIRSYSLPEDLNEFYKDVGVDFHDRLHGMIDSLSDDTEERTRILSKNLEELNPILAKLHPKLGSELYLSFKSFAKHVAKASGGFLRFFSISSEEKSLMSLDMINEIIYEEEDEV